MSIAPILVYLLDDVETTSTVTRAQTGRWEGRPVASCYVGLLQALVDTTRELIMEVDGMEFATKLDVLGAELQRLIAAGMPAEPYQRAQDAFRDEYLSLVNCGYTVFRNGEHWVCHKTEKEVRNGS